MNQLLVIGIGNIIMKDDGIGVRVVEAIQTQLRELNIQFVLGETDVQYCLDEIQQDDFLLIIDAMAEGEEPGSIEIMELDEAIQKRRKLRTQHEFSLLDLISLHYPKANGYFAGIKAAEIDFGFDLSEALQQRFDSICSDVLKAIDTIKEEAEHA